MKGSFYMRVISTSAFLATLTVFAMSAVTVASASAATPEFKPIPTKRQFTSTGGTVTWRWGTQNFDCSKSTTTGGIASATALSGVVIKFTGCKETNSKGSCALKSVGASNSEEVLTHSLKGDLGTVKTSEAASGVGLLLEPEATHTISLLAETTCSPETSLTGSMAGEVSTVGKKQLTNGLMFAVTKGAQNIKTITLASGKKETPELEAWGSELVMEDTADLTFEEALEIT